MIEPPPPAIAEHHDAVLVEQMHAAVQDMPVEPHDGRADAGACTDRASRTRASFKHRSRPRVGKRVGRRGRRGNATMAAAASSSSPRTTSVDHNVIAAAVHRAMTKMMPAIMTEVAKELDPEKK